MSQFASALESVKSITLEAAAVASSKLGETSYSQYSRTISASQLRTLLNSRNSREVRDGLKCLITAIALGDPTLDPESYFPDVVKTVNADEMRIRRLVGVYLNRYAKTDPDIALLVVNSLQKLSSDVNPEIRAFSVKALSDMGLKSLEPIILHSLKKCVTDPSPVVRSEVAISILKLYDSAFDEFEEEFVSLLRDLMADADPQVVSSAIITYSVHFSDNLDWLHGHYRRYCTILDRLDSNAQQYVIQLLTRYAKKYLPRPILHNAEKENEVHELTDNLQNIPFTSFTVTYHDDLKLFLDSLKFLAFSSNPYVVLECFNTYLQLSTIGALKLTKLPKALLRWVNDSTIDDSTRIIILQSILYISTIDSSLFEDSFKTFFLYPHDTKTVGTYKLKVLSALITENNGSQILSECKIYVYSEYPVTIKSEALKSIGIIGQVNTEWGAKTLKWLLRSLEKKSTDKFVLDTMVNVIRVLLHMFPQQNIWAILKLSKILENRDLLHDKARAGVIWLFGEIARLDFALCPDILRKLVQNFTIEDKHSRLQIVLLAAKLLSYDILAATNNESIYDYQSSRLYQIYNGVVYLAKYDDDFDIRDRVRMIDSLFSGDKVPIATLMLQVQKPEPQLIAAKRLLSDDSDDKQTTSQDLTLVHYGVPHKILKQFEFIPWSYDPETATTDDIREPIAVKDYDRYKTSFSSDNFKASARERSFGNSNDNYNKRSISASKTPRDQSTFVSKQGQKYKLQSLDEFFSDVPKSVKKKTTHEQQIQESDGEDTSEEDEESSEEDEDDEEEDEDDEEDSSEDEDTTEEDE